jgi:hypothetical protein
MSKREEGGFFQYSRFFLLFFTGGGVREKKEERRENPELSFFFFLSSFFSLTSGFQLIRSQATGNLLAASLVALLPTFSFQLIRSQATGNRDGKTAYDHPFSKFPTNPIASNREPTRYYSYPC